MIYITYIGQSFWVFVNIWPIILFLFSQLTGPRALPKMHEQLFSKMDSSAEDYGAALASHIMGWCPLLLTSKEPFCACADREVFLDLRSGHLISFLQQSSASATSFVLGVSR